MVSIIGYTYEADTHCVACTQCRFSDPARAVDENGIPFLAVDGGGNFIHPVFDIDEILEGMGCSTCGDIIRQIQTEEAGA